MRKDKPTIDTFLRKVALGQDPSAAAEPPPAAADTDADGSVAAPAPAPAADATTSDAPTLDTSASSSAAAAEIPKADLAQLLFRPVQRMCLYPLLFKQALSERKKLQRWDDAEAAAHAEKAAESGEGVPPSPVKHPPNNRGMIEKLEQVFNVIGQTLGTVNEDVRGLESRLYTMQVLQNRVNGGQDLITPDRVLQHEASVEMKALGPGLGASNCCDLFSSRAAAVRRRYKFYVFSDGVLICLRKEQAWPLLKPSEIEFKLGGEGGGSDEFFIIITYDGVATFHCQAEKGAAAAGALFEAVKDMQGGLQRVDRLRVEEARDTSSEAERVGTPGKSIGAPPRNDDGLGANEHMISLSQLDLDGYQSPC